MARYYFVVHKNADTNYGISFPDFPGCIGAAEDQGEIYDRAKAALEAHIGFLVREGEPIPEPMTIEQASAHELADGARFIGMAHVDPPWRGRGVRANISIDEHLLAEIDRAAEARGMTRSSFLAEGARRLLN